MRLFSNLYPSVFPAIDDYLKNPPQASKCKSLLFLHRNMHDACLPPLLALIPDFWHKLPIQDTSLVFRDTPDLFVRPTVGLMTRSCYAID